MKYSVRRPINKKKRRTSQRGKIKGTRQKCNAAVCRTATALFFCFFLSTFAEGLPFPFSVVKSYAIDDTNLFLWPASSRCKGPSATTPKTTPTCRRSTRTLVHSHSHQRQPTTPPHLSGLCSGHDLWQRGKEARELVLRRPV